jgi:ribose-phosphate pyrophosphokinase
MSHLLIKNGIEEIDVACTHGVFVRDALQKLTAVPQIKEIFATDTVYIPPEKRIPQLHILSVASICGDAIRRKYERKSIQGLFVFGDE